MYLDKYQSWLDSDIVDEETKKELKQITNKKDIEDRFYKDLEFGTGGLRGIIAAGTNRINIYTVGKVTQGLADYLNATYENDISVTIAFDSRNKSDEFAKHVAGVLCANGIKVNLFESLRPTPMLSYAVRYLKSKAGIVVTASHNPPQYNGYKVYGEDGGQVTDIAAKEILDLIESIEDLSQIKTMDFESAKKSGLLNIIGEEVDKTYIEKVKSLSIRKELIKNHAAKLAVIYTPIHGSGNIPVRRVLSELGYKNVTVVKEQELPDGNFPTVSYPNPEDPKVFELALKMAASTCPDIIFGTDPDCDRIGVEVKDAEGNFKVLTGNQMGVLLTHYIISSLKEQNELPSNGTIITTIVSTNMAKKIADTFGIETIEVLTGFKYIGEKVLSFEKKHNKKFLFGFEESYGYLSGDFVRDKDAVIASMLICEMALYYKTKGMNLFDAMQKLYEEYGYFTEKLISIELSGKAGQEKIQTTLEHLRHAMNFNLGDRKIVKKMDYKLRKEKDLIEIKETKIDLPKSNVLKFVLDDGSWFVARPSGTEPKMKIYLSATGSTLKDSTDRILDLEEHVMKIVNAACK